MNELDAILSLCKQEPEAVRGGVLATVVHVEGSAYRRPGARMLILPDGRRIGTVSGGCLESDVTKKAWWFTEHGHAALRAYDTSSGDDAVWEFGLGCNGVVHVLFERMDSSDARELTAFLAKNRTARRGAAVATVVGVKDASRAQLGQRLLVETSGAVGGSLKGSEIEPEIADHASACCVCQRSFLAHLSDCDVFVEWVAAPVPLVIFGAGHDAIPMTKFAKELGWHVTVADGRANYAKRERFPDADQVVVLGREDVLAGIEITRETVVVLMTHNYPMDVVLAENILPSKPRYLGLLGPKSRGEKLLAEAAKPTRGVDVHAPVGLDIGAHTPEAIALSILAEIQASLAGRAGGMLKHRDAGIHEPAEETGAPGIRPLRESALCELA